MHTFTLAGKNLKKNFSFYALYLLSVSFVVSIFFAFTSFSKNQVMLEKISTNGRVESMCSVISLCLMAFVLFYMTYSNRFFLRQRTKELGIYALLGCRTSTVLSLLTFENLLIFGGSLGAGLLLGSLLHRGIVAGITMLLHLSIDSGQIPFFQGDAVKQTVVFFILTVLMIAVSNAFLLMRSSLIELVRYEKKAEKRLRFRKLPSLLGLLLTVMGYALALDIFRGKNSLWVTLGFYSAEMLTFLLVVFGNVLFISSFLPFAVQMGRQNKKSFYRETKIITAPNFIYRIRSNTKTLIMLTLLSSATLTVASVMALSLYYPIAAVSRMAPSELEFRAENQGQVRDSLKLIKSYVPEDEIIITETEIFKVAAASTALPTEYGVGSSKGDSDNEAIVRTPGFECISYSRYIALLQAQGRDGAAKKLPDLKEEECILVKYQPEENSEVGNVYPLLIGGSSLPLTVKETTLDNPISFANSIGTLIVSDSVYEKISHTPAPVTKIVSVNGKSLKDREDLYEDLSRLLQDSPYLQGHSHRVHVIFSLSSSTFLLIGFLVVLFFIATGSILYFNNISAVSDARDDYEILGKMGYTGQKLKKIIRKQVLTFYLIPFALGLLNCGFATVVYRTGLMQNLLGNSLSLYLPAILADAATAVIYLIYYILTVHTCCKTVLKVV